MAKLVGQPGHHRQADAEAAAGIGGRVAAIELVEDAAQLVVGDAGAGVPDSDPQRLTPSQAPDQDAAVFGLLDRVEGQVAHDPLQQ